MHTHSYDDAAAAAAADDDDADHADDDVNDVNYNQAMACCQPSVGTTTISMVGPPISGQCHHCNEFRPMLKTFLHITPLNAPMQCLRQIPHLCRKMFVKVNTSAYGTLHSSNIETALYQQVDFFTFRQFTDPFVFDSLKPQLKLVQSSVGDKEVEIILC